MSQILVVCTANICRSPVVEALLRDRLQTAGYRSWRVVSAGTWAVDPRPPSRYSQEVLRDWEGLDISRHRAQMVDRAMIDAADLVLCMEKGHVEALRVEFPQAADRIFLLSQMDGDRQFNIADPIGTPRPNYEQMVREVRELIENGLARIVELAGNSSRPIQPGD